MLRKMNAILAAGLSLVMAAIAAAPAVAQGARQKDKNNMRNLGTALGAAAIYKGVKGDPKTALILGAGAAYAGKKYEDARKAQRKENTRRYSRSGSYRVYRYRNGKRVGYYRYVNGKRVGYVALR